jgi:hypothetical protein
VLELENVVSCRSGDLRSGTKLNVGSSESFDDLHRSTALGAAMQGAGIVCGRGGGLVCRAQRSDFRPWSYSSIIFLRWVIGTSL